MTTTFATNRIEVEIGRRYVLAAKNGEVAGSCGFWQAHTHDQDMTMPLLEYVPGATQPEFTLAFGAQGWIEFTAIAPYIYPSRLSVDIHWEITEIQR